VSHVVVRLGGGRFGLPMEAVAEVGRLTPMTRVPGTPPWVAGVVNWRGRILGVLDLRILLDVPTAAAADDGRLVVLTSGAVSVGVLAERVEGVIDVAPDSLEAPLITLPAETGALLSGQVTDDEGPVGIVDEVAVFALRHRIGLRRAS
jgi:purine-binding chemotaxis protein CheW